MWLKPHLAEVHPPLGWGPWPCATSPYPATDRLEAKQLRMCLLSKRVEVLRQKSKDWHRSWSFVTGLVVATPGSTPFGFCLGTSIPVLTTSTYGVAWPQGDQPWDSCPLSVYPFGEHSTKSLEQPKGIKSTHHCPQKHRRLCPRDARPRLAVIGISFNLALSGRATPRKRH